MNVHRELKRDLKATAFFCFAFGLNVANSGAAEPNGKAHNMQLTSTAFTEGTAIPIRHTCDDKNVSPPLQWSGAPEGAPLLGGLTLLLARRLEDAIRKAAGFRILAGPI